VGLEAVELDEAPRVEELVDAVARSALALGAALGDRSAVRYTGPRLAFSRVLMKAPPVDVNLD